MSSGKGGLNVKDYPFAFSLAVLLFPPIIVKGEDPTPIIFGITLFGGMLGSILTIINPGSLVIKLFYRPFKSEILDNLRLNKFTSSVIAKNYLASMSSPSISFEIDKLVGMFYFLVVLGLAIYRIFIDHTIVQTLHLTVFQTNILSISVLLGFFGVLATMIQHVGGFKSISQLRRMVIVTILLMANDYVNLSIDGRKIWDTVYNRDERIRDLIRDQFKRSNFKSVKNLDEFKLVFNYPDARRLFGAIYQNSTEEQMTHYMTRFFPFFTLLKELASKYGVEIEDSLWWSNTNRFFEINHFDDSISQLQSAVDSRDWKSAELRTTRITVGMETILREKQPYVI